MWHNASLWWKCLCSLAQPSKTLKHSTQRSSQYKSMFCILLDRLLKIHSISGSYAIHYSSSLVNIFNLKSFILHKSPTNLLRKHSFPAVCADPSWHKSSDTFVHLSRHPLSPLTNITPMRRPKCHRFIKNASTCYPKPVLWLPFRPWLQITGATASAWLPQTSTVRVRTPVLGGQYAQ